jgi:hypothetical protein
VDSLAVGTRGKVFDLEDKRLAESIKGNLPVVAAAPRQELRKITQKDLDDRRLKTSEHPLSIGVLPAFPPDPNSLPLKIDELSFSEEVTQLAVQVSLSLQDWDSREIHYPDAKTKFVYLLTKAGPGGNVLRELASKDSGLDLDFILCAEHSPEMPAARLKIFDRQGKELAETNWIRGERASKLARPALTELATALRQEASQHQNDNKFGALLARLSRDDVELSSNGDVREAHGKLELATEFESSEEKAKKLNEDARKLLKQAVAQDSQDCVAHLLLSSCEYNAGNIKDAKIHLAEAYENRAVAPSWGIRQEIEADYALIYENDPIKSIQKYEELLDRARDEHRNFGLRALRAKWMLAGLYLGDWQAAENEKWKQKYQEEPVAYLDKATDMILDILIYWRNSGEAKYYARYLESARESAPSAPGEKLSLRYKRPSPPTGGRTLKIVTNK